MAITLVTKCTDSSDPSCYNTSILVQIINGPCPLHILCIQDMLLNLKCRLLLRFWEFFTIDVHFSCLIYFVHWSLQKKKTLERLFTYIFQIPDLKFCRILHVPRLDLIRGPHCCALSHIHTTQWWAKSKSPYLSGNPISRMHITLILNDHLQK